MDDSRGYGITIEQMNKVGEPNKHITSRIVSREVKEKIERLIRDSNIKEFAQMSAQGTTSESRKIVNAPEIWEEKDFRYKVRATHQERIIVNGLVKEFITHYEVLNRTALHPERKPGFFSPPLGPLDKTPPDER